MNLLAANQRAGMGKLLECRPLIGPVQVLELAALLAVSQLFPRTQASSSVTAPSRLSQASKPARMSGKGVAGKTPVVAKAAPAEKAPAKKAVPAKKGKAKKTPTKVRIAV